MRFVDIGEKTFNVEAIDYLEGQEGGHCHIHLRNGEIVDVHASLGEITEMIFQPADALLSVPETGRRSPEITEEHLKACREG